MISQPDWKRFSTFTFSTLAAARVEKVDVENDALAGSLDDAILSLVRYRSVFFLPAPTSEAKTLLESQTFGKPGFHCLLWRITSLDSLASGRLSGLSLDARL